MPSRQNEENQDDGSVAYYFCELYSETMVLKSSPGLGLKLLPAVILGPFPSPSLPRFLKKDNQRKTSCDSAIRCPSTGGREEFLLLILQTADENLDSILYLFCSSKAPGEVTQAFGCISFSWTLLVEFQ